MTLPAGEIARFSRVVADLDRAEAFYCEALGFRRVARGPLDPATLAAFGVPGGAEQVELELGGAVVALVRFEAAGRPYPADSRSDDLWFQHLAVVVTDMAAAYAHLCAAPGWRPISRGGPQLLPPRDGGVRAFKFRDPDGHPLELIWFPRGTGRALWQGPGPLFRGIDHSGLAVASTPRSLAFYGALGLRPGSRSLNRGPAQARLDGLPRARARITGLRPAVGAGPGLELLRYVPAGRPDRTRRANDLATDWVTIARDGPARALRDPDGHLILLGR